MDSGRNAASATAASSPNAFTTTSAGEEGSGACEVSCEGVGIVTNYCETSCDVISGCRIDIGSQTPTPLSYNKCIDIVGKTLIFHFCGYDKLPVSAHLARRETKSHSKREPGGLLKSL